MTLPRPRRAYPTDLSDAEWALLEPLIPPVKPGGRSARHTRRELVNAIAYWIRAGYAWRLLPHDLPPWQTVYRRPDPRRPWVEPLDGPGDPLRRRRCWRETGSRSQ